MKRYIKIFCILPIIVFLLIPLIQAEQCYECHQSWEDEDGPSNLIELDVHFKVGLGCSDCHGGNPDLDDMDDVRESKSYRGVPGAREIPDLCASCHSNPSYMIKFNPSLPTDQLDKYKTSVHGMRLLGKSDTKVANCVSCHSVHNIQGAIMPASTVNAFNLPGTCASCHADSVYMKSYGIPTDQYSYFVKSVHGIALLEHKDMGAPSCNDCHGNHGAIPPGVKSISAVCGLCHALEAEKFSASPHEKAFEAKKYPQCEICHSNHLIVKPKLDWVGTSDSSLCTHCHKPNDGTGGLTAASAIHAALQDLQIHLDRARTKVDSADNKGMMVTDELFLLKDIDQAAIQAKTMVHTFNADSVESITMPAIDKATTVYEAGAAKIDEYYFRRKGLGIATLIITLIAIALYFKIRAEKK